MKRTGLLAQFWKQAKELGADDDPKVLALLSEIAGTEYVHQTYPIIAELEEFLTNEFRLRFLIKKIEPEWMDEEEKLEISEGPFLLGHTSDNIPIHWGLLIELSTVVLIVGQPGRGKTSLGVFLARQILENCDLDLG